MTPPAVMDQPAAWASHALTRRESWPAGADSVTPAALTLHPAEVLATENRSWTGASGAFGAGIEVMVRCQVLSMVTEISRSPTNRGGGLTGCWPADARPAPGRARSSSAGR